MCIPPKRLQCQDDEEDEIPFSPSEPINSNMVKP
jgi:hypothetical protein